MSAQFVMRPVGVIHTPFTETKGMPIQPAFSDARGRVVIFPEYAGGFQDIVRLLARCANVLEVAGVDVLDADAIWGAWSAPMRRPSLVFRAVRVAGRPFGIRIVLNAS
jgi:tRNA (Thr-GGU) A37 N-methylase